MTILFDARRTVKSARRFGAGLLASAPVYRDEVSQADRQWAAAEFAALAEAQAAGEQFGRYFPLVPRTAEDKAVLRDAYIHFAASMETAALDALYADRVAEDCLTRGLDPSSDPEYRGAWGGFPSHENN
jgi:hypothetical protein